MTNEIILAGNVVDKPIFSHESFGEKFYRFSISVMRNSGTEDVLVCTIPEILLGDVLDKDRVKIRGQIRSRNEIDDGIRRLCITVFVMEVMDDRGKDENSVVISGAICTRPIHRRTPLGREITDFMLASNRETGASDYIPCVTWGRSSHRVNEMCVGNYIDIKGRLQSRTYEKTTDDSIIVRTVYEISVGSFRCEYKEQE